MRIVLLAAPLMLAACASSYQPISPTQYAAMDCAQLNAERAQLLRLSGRAEGDGSNGWNNLSSGDRSGWGDQSAINARGYLAQLDAYHYQKGCGSSSSTP
ncbi:hypothetical protein [Halotalea alkalilenta]|uniref:Lipoprotein n=1 Tax=Halotalea alkalilenta TaxID=376489 RepID=A0A172YFU4_9GAMM|nr:hypothetical protein [Halotalea alkalilenta]ANF58077.1 hypothetical protein A5892_11875 [Halotalea alkalilenta]